MIANLKTAALLTGLALLSATPTPSLAQSPPPGYVPPGVYVPPRSGAQTPAALSRRYYSPDGSLRRDRALMLPRINHPTPEVPPRATKRIRPRKLSCGRVRKLLRRSKYKRVRATDCRGRTYGFDVRKGRLRYLVEVDAYTGVVTIKDRR